MWSHGTEQPFVIPSLQHRYSAPARAGAFLWVFFHLAVVLWLALSDGGISDVGIWSLTSGQRKVQ